MATAEEHRQISAQFLNQADEEFRKGDLLQASEKAWGAFSHYVNFVARRNHWPLGSHKALIENANRMISRDSAHVEDRRRLVRSVAGLHSNFYQAFLDEDSVRGGIDDAKELISALAELDVDT